MFNNPINAAKDRFKGLFGGDKQDDGNNIYAGLPDNYDGGDFGNDRGKQMTEIHTYIQ